MTVQTDPKIPRLQAVHSISSLPHVQAQIMALVASASSGATEMENVIASDPPLAMRVLRLANSPRYTMGRSIDSIRTAVLILGFEEIRNLALSAGIAKLFSSSFSHPLYSRAALWRHSTSVAICNRMIARRTLALDMDTAFIAGVVHDIGIIIEDQYHHKHFMETLRLIEEERLPLSQAERRVFRHDHGHHGMEVAKSWSLPPTIYEAIAHHHDPAKSDAEWRIPATMLHLSDILCRLKFNDKVGEIHGTLVNKFVLDTLSLSTNDVKIFFNDLEQEIRDAKNLFNLINHAAAPR